MAHMQLMVAWGEVPDMQAGGVGCRIYNLRKPKTNIQILQQNVLLKHKHLASFLRRHAREVHMEVSARTCTRSCSLRLLVGLLFCKG